MGTTRITPKEMKLLNLPIEGTVVFKNKDKFPLKGVLTRLGEKQGTIHGKIMNPYYRYREQDAGNFLMKDVAYFEVLA